MVESASIRALFRVGGCGYDGGCVVVITGIVLVTFSMLSTFLLLLAMAYYTHVQHTKYFRGRGRVSRSHDQCPSSFRLDPPSCSRQSLKSLFQMQESLLLENSPQDHQYHHNLKQKVKKKKNTNYYRNDADLHLYLKNKNDFVYLY